MSEKKWRETEKIVSYLEKRIAGDAKVEHDVKLLDRTGDSQYRQCDIVIRQGKPPRETITIVEVQDRNSAVDINTFDGFVAKMRKVGAQHLIVVSKQPFPESIKKLAKREGPSIRLVNLSMLEKGEFPITNMVDYTNREISAISDFVIGAKVENRERCNLNKCNINDKLFLYNERLLSFSELFFQYCEEREIVLHEGTNRIEILINKDHDLKLKYEELLFKISIKATVTVEVTRDLIQFDYFEYKQHDFDNPLIWYAEAKGKYGNSEVSIKLSYTYDEETDGYLMKVEEITGDFQKVELVTFG